MSAITPDTGATRPANDLVGWLRRNWWLPAGLVVLAAVLGYQQLTKVPPALPPAAPVVVEKTPARPEPKLDPMERFSKPLTPLAANVTGWAYEDKVELAHRLDQLVATGVDECGVFIGSDGQSWTVSATYSAAHPVPIFAGCPWPPGGAK